MGQWIKVELSFTLIFLRKTRNVHDLARLKSSLLIVNSCVQEELYDFFFQNDHHQTSSAINVNHLRRVLVQTIQRDRQKK